jgi:hypothetical protein
MPGCAFDLCAVQIVDLVFKLRQHGRTVTGIARGALFILGLGAHTRNKHDLRVTA